MTFCKENCIIKGNLKEREADIWKRRKDSYENVILPEQGFDIRFVTMKHNSPFHWHRELEILYILNGHATVRMDDLVHQLNPLDAIRDGLLEDP